MACGDVTGIRVPHLCFHCVQHSGADDAGMYNCVTVLQMWGALSSASVMRVTLCRYTVTFRLNSICELS